MLLTVAGSDFAVAKIVFGRNVNGFLLTSCLPTLISDLVQQQLSKKIIFGKSIVCTISKYEHYTVPQLNLKGRSGQIRFTWELEGYLFDHQLLKTKIFHLLDKYIANTQIYSEDGLQMQQQLNSNLYSSRSKKCQNESFFI